MFLVTGCSICVLLVLRSNVLQELPLAGSGVVRIDPLRFLAGCCVRRLNQV